MKLRKYNQVANKQGGVSLFVVVALITTGVALYTTPVTGSTLVLLLVILMLCVKITFGR